MAAAFELSRPERTEQLDITIYQQGFRLGGKGASGRGVNDRIEEHGLHLWMGFYENAFRLMRECYAELRRDPTSCPISEWQQAFEPADFSGVADWSPSGRWTTWRVLFPPVAGLPGDPESPSWTVADYLKRCLVLVRTLLDSLPLPEDQRGSSETAAEAFDSFAPGDAAARIAQLVKFGELATLGGLREALGILSGLFELFGSGPSLVGDALGPVRAAVDRQLDLLVESDDEVRRLWEIADLVLAVVRGCVRDRLLTDPRGFDAINDVDCREWLLQNGARRTSVDSAFVRALYDLAFAYEDGDVHRPRIAAGQALRGAVRAFFTYRGSFFWRMNGGMGDIVFAPFYEVLKARGVKFEFFHRLENMHISSDPSAHVSALDFDVQAEVRGQVEYQPLVDIHGLPCWPSRPDYRQLLDGERLEAQGVDFECFWDLHAARRHTLRVEDDFDFVILAVGGGAVPHVCRELVRQDPRWRAMVDHVKTVATQALQVWSTASTRELGFVGPPTNISGFSEPFDTWADMSHLISAESWQQPVRSIGYFCSVLPDAPEQFERAVRDYPARRTAEVRDNAQRFLEWDIRHLWPAAVSADGGFPWSLLAAPDGQEGLERFRAQYFRANVSPSERYTLSLPGSLKHRISPLKVGYDNLTVAGDWTDCGFNEGCVEAAMMSGRLAAHALTGFPRLEEITGFDHP
jgi:uncharacterized protein with NAD-binding domain and iron-sulfur cluster